MPRSRRGQMRSPFKHGSISSPSLEGMDRPVRSFKSFIKTVPPSPSPSRNNQPLPETCPSPKKEIPSPTFSTPSPASPASGRASSVTSWKAPAEWAFSPETYKQENPPTPPVPSSRQYSPLLPEPSPDLTDRFMEARAAQGEATPPRSRLMPIYERAQPDMGPPSPPPRGPLPKTPDSASKRSSKLGPPGEQIEKAFSFEKDEEDILAPAFLPNVPRHAASSSAQSTPSERSYVSSEKAHKALGIDGSRELPASVGDGPHFNNTLSGSEAAHVAVQHPVIKRTRPANTGNPLAENNYEDPEMDERTRQLSFSQDYHDLLADQYQELSVQPEEVLRTGPRKDSITDPMDVIGTRPKHPLEDHPLRPQPLAWNKSNVNSSRTASGTIGSVHEIGFPASDSASSNKRKRGRLSSWVPRRLSVGLQRGFSVRGDKNASAGEKRTKQRHDEDAEKSPTDVFNFSKFFGPGMPMGLGKKANKGKATAHTSGEEPRAPTPPTISPSAPTPLMRLPGGLAVIRTPPQVPNSEQASLSESSTPREQTQHTIPAVAYENTSTPTSNPMSRSSLSYRGPNRVSTLRNVYRSSSLSRKRNSTPLPLQSQRFSTITVPSANPRPERPARPERPEPQAPQEPQIPQVLQVPQEPQESKTPSAWKRWSTGPETMRRRSSLIDRVRDATKPHAKMNRHDELKKSIRVLGPTYTGAVDIEGNAGRRPGYLVS